MRKIIAVISFFIFANLAYSQDIITLKNGDRLKVKVIQVNAKDVTYTKPEETTGKLYSIDFSEIFIIIFEKKNAKYLQNNKASADTTNIK
jgi:hypothetical protein